MKRLLFLILVVSSMPFLRLYGQVDPIKYYNKDIFKVKTSDAIEYNSQKFKKVNPEDVDGLLKRGVEKLQKKFYKEAILDFEEALKIYPKSAYSYYYFGSNI